MKKSEQGQIVVFILVVIVVLVTVLLSMWTRTIQQRKINLGAERSSRAFTAAEAAIEEAQRRGVRGLVGSSFPIEGLAGVSASATVSELTDFVIDLDRDDVVQVDLVTDTASWDGVSNINFCWEATGAGNDPAIEITFYAEAVGGEVSLIRYAFNAGTDYGNRFVNPGGTDRGFANLSEVSVNCSGYENEVFGIPVDPGFDNTEAVYIRIKSWYAPAKVKVVGVPRQVIQVTGEGVTDAGERRTVRTETYPASWPPIFDFVLFDGSDNPLRK